MLNKVLKYSIDQNEPDIKLSKFINDKDCYVSNDDYKYDGNGRERRYFSIFREKKT